MISPAPWEAVGNAVRDAESIEVCEVKFWRDNVAENARLLAAAPDLLKACVEAIAVIERHCEDYCNADAMCANCTQGLVLERLRATTAKAGGEPR